MKEKASAHFARNDGVGGGFAQNYGWRDGSLRMTGGGMVRSE
jgi:hypothetical protein